MKISTKKLIMVITLVSSILGSNALYATCIQKDDQRLNSGRCSFFGTCHYQADDMGNCDAFANNGD